MDYFGWSTSFPPTCFLFLLCMVYLFYFIGVVGCFVRVIWCLVRLVLSVIWCFVSLRCIPKCYSFFSFLYCIFLCVVSLLLGFYGVCASTFLSSLWLVYFLDYFLDYFFECFSFWDAGYFIFECPCGTRMAGVCCWFVLGFCSCCNCSCCSLCCHFLFCRACRCFCISADVSSSICLHSGKFPLGDIYICCSWSSLFRYI